ncbi:malto-oligosyltrehalose synthase [Oleiagrimonas sp. C23AA]|uniref:malto-oligosyltrehalose synthase n=1 Tax=Oleiagrimonas sp. C23AA TaxID=2719047 RepID=UPI00142385F6|nr:malto-oligosyltrehalose synthase [Oleiagrimonas sp. C23AA]NII11135.1 malto-oligosyltrehalose synthase [Oleiagrimonas sp. C23AA]
MTDWRATARLQCHAGFTLDDAAAQVPRLARLGISHLYTSPLTAAVPGSTHGYDGVDPTRISPELGGEAALKRLVHALHAHDMGLLLDIVPNHLAAHADNPWWQDVLRHGTESPYAGYFDIDWKAPGAQGRLQWPVLDRPYAQALQQGVLTVMVEGDNAWFCHHQQRFPLYLPRQRCTHAIDAEWASKVNQSPQALHELHERQAYHLLWWRAGHDQINIRRFFDITSLVAVRVERREVFDAMHALPLALIERGWVDGLRIDHIDGLTNPAAYLDRLRRRMDIARKASGRPGPARLWVEKILANHETLPEAWPVEGSTGYDFMAETCALLHMRRGQQQLQRDWTHRTGMAGIEQEERRARRQILETSLYAEWQRAVRALHAVSRHEAAQAELSEHAWQRALGVVLGHLRVYRSYATPDGLSDPDRQHLAPAFDQARADAGPLLIHAMDALWAVLGDHGEDSTAARTRRRHARQRFEQLAAPLNAKAVEDRLFYRHGATLALNEVGSQPQQPVCSAADFHAAATRRAVTHPRSLLALSTHDHKRGADVRARLAVLSECAPWWIEQTRRWQALSQSWRLGSAPDTAEALMLYQTLFGTWPRVRERPGAALPADYVERILAWQRKALREAARHSSWMTPDNDYEHAVEHFIRHLLQAPEGHTVREGLDAAVTRLAPAGAVNGLAQLALALCTPGVPDIYQGVTGWDDSLVDPDNRRAPDHAREQHWLQDTASWAELLAQWPDGRVRHRLIARLLELRRMQPELFMDARYVPLQPRGPAPLLAFAREHRLGLLICVLPRGPFTLGVDHALSFAEGAWQETRLAIPEGHYRHVLSGRSLRLENGQLEASELFDHGPIGVLLREPAPPCS